MPFDRDCMFGSILIFTILILPTQEHGISLICLCHLSSVFYNFLCTVILSSLCLQVGGFISRLSILFHWSVFLFLCQYHTVLMIVALQYNLKSGRLILPAPFFFLKTTLAVWVFLCFHMKCEIFCSSSVKNAIGNLIGICRLHLVVQTFSQY